MRTVWHPARRSVLSEFIRVQEVRVRCRLQVYGALSFSVATLCARVHVCVYMGINDIKVLQRIDNSKIVQTVRMRADITCSADKERKRSCRAFCTIEFNVSIRNLTPDTRRTPNTPF